MNRLVTGLTALPLPMITAMNLTLRFLIKVSNNLISIIKEPMDMVQESKYLFPVIPFVDRFQSKIPVINLQIKNTFELLYIHKKYVLLFFIALSITFFFFNC